MAEIASQDLPLNTTGEEKPQEIEPTPVPEVQKHNDATVQSTTLEDNHILHVVVTDSAGQTATASFDLDSCIGNVNGALSLGGTGFSSQARSVSLAEGGQILDAELADVNGDYSTSSLGIAHTVAVYDGQVSLLMSMDAPHSSAHADSATVTQADEAMKGQAKMVDGESYVVNAMTTSIHQDYQMPNPNEAATALLQDNLGPFGSSQARQNTSNFVSNVQLGWQIGHSCILM